MSPEDSLWERENGAGGWVLSLQADRSDLDPGADSACDEGPEVLFPCPEDESHIAEPLGEL